MIFENQVFLKRTSILNITVYGCFDNHILIYYVTAVTNCSTQILILRPTFSQLLFKQFKKRTTGNDGLNTL